MCLTARKLMLHETVDRLALADLWAPETQLALAPVTKLEHGRMIYPREVRACRGKFRAQSIRAITLDQDLARKIHDMEEQALRRGFKTLCKYPAQTIFRFLNSYEQRQIRQMYENQSMARLLPRLTLPIGNIVLSHLKTARAMLEMHRFVNGTISFVGGYEAIMKSHHVHQRIHIRFDPTLVNSMVFESRIDTILFDTVPQRTFTLQSTFNFGTRPYTKCKPGNTKTDLYGSIPRNVGVPCTWTFKLPAMITGVSLY